MNDTLLLILCAAATVAGWFLFGILLAACLRVGRPMPPVKDERLREACKELRVKYRSEAI